MTKLPKPPKRFKFSDDIMFSLVMADKEICAEVITRIIGNEIGEIKHIITQRTLVNKPKLKYTRFDVCVETTEGKLYDVEIQISDKHNLERRMRYYQSMLDASTTRSGTEYENLPDTYIIFICDFDYFEEGEPLYFFENLCKNKDGLVFKDGTYKVVVNLCEYEKCENERLKLLLHYIKTNAANDDLTRRIDDMVNSNAYQQNALEEFFHFSAIDQDRAREIRKDAFKAGEAKGIEKGIQKGIEKGAYQKACETARNLLEMGLNVDKITLATGLSEDEISRLQ